MDQDTLRQIYRKLRNDNTLIQARINQRAMDKSNGRLWVSQNVIDKLAACDRKRITENQRLMQAISAEFE